LIPFPHNPKALRHRPARAIGPRCKASGIGKNSLPVSITISALVVTRSDASFYSGNEKYREQAATKTIASSTIEEGNSRIQHPYSILPHYHTSTLLAFLLSTSVRIAQLSSFYHLRVDSSTTLYLITSRILLKISLQMVN
jgi:hypothetical protein